MSSARLVVVCGLPGVGKTTYATELARTRDAIRLSADEWMDRLGINLWDRGVRERVEDLQWDFAQQLLQLDHEVIIEWGTWSRNERDALRRRAQELGAETELHYLHAPHDDLLDRLRARAADSPPPTERQLRKWADVFEPPDEQEGATWDRFATIGPEATEHPPAPPR